MTKKEDHPTAFFIREPLTARVLVVIEAADTMQAAARFHAMRLKLPRELLDGALSEIVGIEQVEVADDAAPYPHFSNSYFDTLEALTATQH
jgi:hypothetical protein